MAYAPIIVPADLKTSMYPEVQAIIIRGDNTIATEAIDSAISEAKMYLSKYDLVQLFGDPTVTTANPSGIAASFTDVFLNDIVKTIAVWNILRLASPNIDMQVAVTRYEQAIGSLKNIQKGYAMPAGWPYNATPATNIPDGDAIEWTARPKRRNYFY